MVSLSNSESSCFSNVLLNLFTIWICIGAVYQIVFVSVIGKIIKYDLVLFEPVLFCFDLFEALLSPEFGEICFVDAVYNITKLVHYLT